MFILLSVLDRYCIMLCFCALGLRHVRKWSWFFFLFVNIMSQYGHRGRFRNCILPVERR